MRGICGRCGKSTRWSKNVQRVENPLDETDYTDFHLVCYLKNQLDDSDKRIKQLEEDLCKFNRINSSMIIGAITTLQERWAGKSTIVFSPEFYTQMLKDVNFIQHLIHPPPYKEIIGKEFSTAFGKELKVDSNIVGWYIKKVKKR